MARIYRSNVLKQYPFVLKPGEHFVAETFVYHQINQQYTLATLNKMVTVRHYLEDGYSKNIRAVTRANPKGYRKLKRMSISYSDTPKAYVENTILYMVGCILCGETVQGIKGAPSKLMALIVLPIAGLLVAAEFRDGKDTRVQQAKEKR